MSEYTQGVCQDGAAILKDDQPLTIEQILEALRERDSLKAHAVAVAAAVGFDDGHDCQFNASVQVTCIENAKRFFDHLSAIEREFFMVPGQPDEDYPGADPDDECLVNGWGSTTEQYVEQFRKALARRDALQQANGFEELYDETIGYTTITRGTLIDRARMLRKEAEGHQ